MGLYAPNLFLQLKCYTFQNLFFGLVNVLNPNFVATLLPVEIASACHNQIVFVAIIKKKFYILLAMSRVINLNAVQAIFFLQY